MTSTSKSLAVGLLALLFALAIGASIARAQDEPGGIGDQPGGIGDQPGDDQPGGIGDQPGDDQPGGIGDQPGDDQPGGIGDAPPGVPTGAKPTIAVTKTVEDGETLVVATVTREGIPVEGAKVQFFVKRTFGMILIGEEETFDDGTAMAIFPASLPGGATGELTIVVKITSPDAIAGAIGEARLAGGKVFVADNKPFARALWAPHAPLPLLLSVVILVGGVWCAFLVVVFMLFKIRREGKKLARSAVEAV